MRVIRIAKAYRSTKVPQRPRVVHDTPTGQLSWPRASAKRSLSDPAASRLAPGTSRGPWQRSVYRLR